MTEKAVSLLMSYERNWDLSVVLGLQNLPYYTQRNPIQEETKNPFLLMIFVRKQHIYIHVYKHLHKMIFFLSF